MKRILSILMSMALIASLLVSMSVTSFAVAEKENEVGTDMATVETTVVSVDATEFANSGKTLEDGTYGWLITTTIDFHEEQAPNILLHDDGLTVSGRLVDALSFEYNLSEAVIYSKRSGMSTTTYAFMNETAVSGMLGAVEQKKYITHDFSANTAPEKFPYKEALEGTVNPDGTPQTKLTHSVYLATTTESFEMDVKVTILTSALTGDLDNPVATIDTVAPEYWERGIVVGEVEPATYEITFKNEGSDTVLNDGNTTYEENATVTAPAEPTEPANADPAYNYTFAGWSDGSKTYASNEIPVATDNVEYTAVFNSVKKTVTATFVVEGKANVTETVEYGGTPTAAGVDTTVEGKTFTGWSPALGSITADTTYTAILTPNAPTQYEITFVVDGDETIVMTNAGISPVYTKGTPSKDGHTFEGWEAEDGTVYTGELPVATANATYEAVFAPIPAVDSKVTITAVDRITGDIFPISGKGTAEVTTLSGKKETIEAARLHRVHTTFTYEPGDYPLVEMGMLFVPKVVVDEAGIAKDAEEIANAGIAKDANCKNLPGEITGGVANFIFKAGLVDVPTTIEGKSTKGIIIYAIPYYTLSDGTIKYHGVFDTEF